MAVTAAIAVGAMTEVMAMMPVDLIAAPEVGAAVADNNPNSPSSPSSSRNLE